MRQVHRHENCPRADQLGPWNPTPGLLRAAFITLGERKHRVGYLCLDCGLFQFEPDIGYLIALRQREKRRGRGLTEYIHAHQEGLKNER